MELTGSRVEGHDLEGGEKPLEQLPTELRGIRFLRTVPELGDGDGGHADGSSRYWPNLAVFTSLAVAALGLLLAFYVLKTL